MCKLSSDASTIYKILTFAYMYRILGFRIVGLNKF
jgi:hypothetical protein